MAMTLKEIRATRKKLMTSLEKQRVAGQKKIDSFAKLEEKMKAAKK
jgi:hypothetical protein